MNNFKKTKKNYDYHHFFFKRSNNCTWGLESNCDGAPAANTTTTTITTMRWAPSSSSTRWCMTMMMSSPQHPAAAAISTRSHHALVVVLVPTSNIIGMKASQPRLLPHSPSPHQLPQGQRIELFEPCYVWEEPAVSYRWSGCIWEIIITGRSWRLHANYRPF